MSIISDSTDLRGVYIRGGGWLSGLAVLPSHGPTETLAVVAYPSGNFSVECILWILLFQISVFPMGRLTKAI